MPTGTLTSTGALTVVSNLCSASGSCVRPGMGGAHDLRHWPGRAVGPLGKTVVGTNNVTVVMGKHTQSAVGAQGAQVTALCTGKRGVCGSM